MTADAKETKEMSEFDKFINGWIDYICAEYDIPRDLFMNFGVMNIGSYINDHANGRNRKKWIKGLKRTN